MKLVFLSNYYNHHQKALCAQLHESCSSFWFVETSQMREERRALGYGEQHIPSYVIQYSDKTKAMIDQAIRDADAVLWGGAPSALVQERIRGGKLVLRCSERLFKKKESFLRFLPRYIKWQLEFPRGKAAYLLAASAYAAADYARFGSYRNHAYKWGYFPATHVYDTQELMAQKQRTRLLWCGRFLDWKHPDDAVRVAKRLMDDGYDFTLDFIGTGEMNETLQSMVADYGLQERVHFLGSMKPDQVREHMEQAGIYLFTSDRQEGWGAVLNEAMNAGCAVVASTAAGSTPFMIHPDQNGKVYTACDTDALYATVKELLDDVDKQVCLGKAAYDTIVSEWNATIAAKRLLELISRLQSGEECDGLFRDGPCSRAEIVRD